MSDGYVEIKQFKRLLEVKGYLPPNLYSPHKGVTQEKSSNAKSEGTTKKMRDYLHAKLNDLQLAFLYLMEFSEMVCIAFVLVLSTHCRL
jgi:hypothetical protein